jgi:hypothetical protein
MSIRCGSLCSSLENFVAFAIWRRFDSPLGFHRAIPLAGRNVRWQAIILVLPVQTEGEASRPGYGVSLL